MQIQITNYYKKVQASVEAIEPGKPRSDTLNISEVVTKLSKTQISPAVNTKIQYKIQKQTEKPMGQAQKHKNIQCKERALVSKDIKKMIGEAKIAERLSDNEVGGGLGKRKRYNRLIAAGKQTRGENFKRRSMRYTEAGRKSSPSLKARDISVDNARYMKSMSRNYLEPQGLFEHTVKHEAPEEFIDAINNVAKTLEDKTVDMGTETLSVFEKLVEALKALSHGRVDIGFDTANLKELLPSTSSMMWVAVTVAMLYIGQKAIRSRSLAKMFLSLVGLITVIGPAMCTRAREALSSILEWFKNKITDSDNGIVEQSFSGHIIDSAMAFIYYTHFKAAAAKDSGGKMFANFVERISKMKRNYEGLEFSFSFFLKIMQEMLDWVSKQFGTRRYNVAFDNRPEVTLYAEKVTATVDLYVKGKDINAEAAEQIIGLYTEGKKLEKELPNTVEYVESRKLLNAAIGEVTPWVLKVRRSNVYNNGPRIEPLGIFLTGPSGVGKTTALVPLILGVTGKVLPDDKIDAFLRNHNDFIYNRISENEYYDAYTGQFNCIFDDLGQTADVKGVNDNPYMEVIRMVNSHNMDLHAAHLDDKGNMNFKSRIVWATSNVNKFRLQSIISNEALTRRFRCSYMVIPKVGFREDESQVDPWKMRLRKDVQIHDFEHIEFMKYDVLNGEIDGHERYTLEQVIDLIVTAYKEVDKFGTKLLHKHQEFKEKYVRQRKAMSEPDLRIDIDGEEPLIRKSKSFDEKIQPQGGEDSRIVGDAMYAMGRPKAVNDLVQTGAFGATYWSIMSMREAMGDKSKKPQPGTPIPTGRHTLESLIEQSHTPEEVLDSCKPTGERLQETLEAYKEHVIKAYEESPSFKEIAGSLLTFKNMVMLAGAASACFALKKIFSSFSKPDDEPKTDKAALSVSNSNMKDLIENSSHKAAPKGGVRNKREGFKKGRFIKGYGKGHRQLRGHKLEEQLAYDSNCEDILLKIWKHNVYAIRGQDQTKNLGYVTFIGGHDAVMPAHFMEKYSKLHDSKMIDDDFCLILTRASEPLTTFSVRFLDLENFYPDAWEGEDVVFTRFPNTIPNAPNIRRYFVKEEEFKHVEGKFTGKLCLPLEGKHCQVHTTNMYSVRDIAYTDYVVTHMFAYAIPTKEGHCGALCAVSNPVTGPRKIIGIHTAGNPKAGVGYAIKVSSDMIDEFYKAFGDQAYVDQPYLLEKDLTEKTIEPQGFKELYEAEKPNVPAYTNIVASPLQDTFSPHVCEPAKLSRFINSENVVVDPWVVARSNYRKDSPYVNGDILRQCTISYLRVMMNQSANDVPWGPKVFSFEEAVRGVPGIPNCEAIPRNTSPGYPWALNIPKGHKGKTHFFGTEEEFEFSSVDCAKLKRRVEDIIKSASRGIRLEHIYMDFLKDERRKKRKVEEGASRLVSASPVDLLVVFRMYFLDFVRWYMNNRLHNGSAVGINPFSQEWDALYRYLQADESTDHIIAGDFKGYDGCLYRQIQSEFLWMANKWYNDGNERIREILFEEVCNSRHIYQDVVYEWPGSNPSGCFVTTIMNSCCNNIILRYAGILAYSSRVFNRVDLPYIRMPQKEVAAVLNHIEQSTRIATFGDDNLLSIRCKTTQKWLNQNTLTESLYHIGFVYTPEDKSTDSVKPFRNINEVSFLKRQFRFDPMVNYVIAPLDISVVLEMSQWTKRNDRNWDNVKENVDTTLKELSAHGQEVWDHWYPLIAGAARDHLEYIPLYHDRVSALRAQLARDETGM